MINSKELLSYTRNLSILFAEDNEQFRVATSEILKNFFMRVDQVQNGQDALEKYIQYYKTQGKYYDLVISDIRMPIMDGVALTSKLYDIRAKQPVIILSAHDEKDYLLPLINLGIEQFVQKPIDYQELLKVLLAVAKKIIQNQALPVIANTQITLSDSLVFNRDLNTLTQNQESIYLTKYEILFLRLLTTNVGKIYSNEDIVSKFSLNNEKIDAANIRKLVSKLRKKLPKDCIESTYGIGYRLVPYFKI
jgi:DNA-binding response OmpR family regulator